MGIQPTEADIGRKVIYREPGDFPGAKVEYGRITSFNDRFVFVRYGQHTSTSAATSREDLGWDQ